MRARHATRFASAVTGMPANAPCAVTLSSYVIWSIATANPEYAECVEPRFDSCRSQTFEGKMWNHIEFAPPATTEPPNPSG